MNGTTVLLCVILALSTSVPAYGTTSLKGNARHGASWRQMKSVQEEDGGSSNGSCSSFRHYPTSQQCSYIGNTTSCHFDGGYINYLRLPYCLLSGYEVLGLVIVFLWMMYIFFALSVVVDLILCPSLKVITTALNMDEDVAGVTFLAFANGAADIFSLLLLVLRGDGDDDDDITGVAGMGSILGGGLFVVCISSGLIAINYPLDNIEKWPFVRNILFYLAAVAWMTGMLADGKIYLGEAIGFIGLYVGYVFIVWVGHRISRSKETRKAASQEANERTPLVGSTTSPTYSGTATTPAERNGGGSVPAAQQRDTLPHGTAPPSGVGRGLQSRTRDAQVLPSTAIDLSLSLENTMSQSNVQPEHGLASAGIESFPDVEQKEVEAVSDVPSEPTHVVGFRRLRDALLQEELRHPRQAKWYFVVHAVLAFPVRLALLLTCPTVDEEKEDCGWNKYLTMITMVIFPSFAALAFDGYFQELQDEVILGPFLAALGLIFALAVLLFTSVKTVPSGKVLFAAISFLMAITWIYIMADEVVNIVITFATSLNATGAILGLLMIAAGNSVCDMIANFFVARSGKPLMGFAASYGSPLLNMLIGIGIATTTAIVRDGKPYSLKFPLLLQVASGFLSFSLALALVMVACRHWSAGRMLGLALLGLYFVFFAASIALELTDSQANGS